MMMKMLLIFAVAGMSFLAMEKVGAVTLIKNGRANCTIVVGRDDRHAKIHSMRYSDITHALPAQIIRDSAQDLAEHLNEIGGIWDPRYRVQVVDDISAAKTGCRILLGSAAVEAYNLQDEAAEIPYPGYVYRTTGNDLLIFGSSSKGTANGIYGFLQDELAVRWFGPQDLFKVVTPQTAVELQPLHKTVQPSFAGRLVHVSAFLWGRRRMRMVETVDEGEPFRNTSHNLWRILPPAKYGEKHPEYYAVRAGRRQEADRHIRNFTICYANPQVIDIATTAALNYFRADQRHHSFSLGINDAPAYCECTECAKLQPQRSFRGRRVASDMYYSFVNEVARRVQREFPDRYLGAIAYNDVTLPPLGAMEKNVHVVLVNDISEYYDADYRARDEELVQAWREKGITPGLYYYTQLAKLVPAHFPRLLAEELKDKHARGFTSITSEMGNGWPWHGPMAYVEARLLWDIDLSVEDLLNEYFESLFGPASTPMRQLYDLFEQIHWRPRGGGFLYEHYNIAQFRPYDATDLAEIRRLLSEAHAAIPQLGVTSGQDGLEGRRVAYVTEGLKIFLDMLEGFALTERLQEYSNSERLDDVAAMEVLEIVKAVNTLLDRHDMLYRETIINDESLPGRFRRDTCTPVRNHWKSICREVVGNALAHLYKQADSDQVMDGRVKVNLRNEIARYTADEQRNVLFQLTTGELKPGENQVVNPGFEIVGRDFELPEHLNWSASAAYGWAYWQHSPNMGAFEILKQSSRTGKRAGLMRGIGNGCFITMIPQVESGKMYYVRAYIKNTAHVTRERKPSVRMEVRWLDENKNWAKRGIRFFDESAQLDDWVRLETIAKVPANVASAVILITASPLENNEEIFVDDVLFSPLD